MTIEGKIDVSTTGTALLRRQRSLFEGAEAPIGLDEYQQFTTRTDRNGRAGTEGLGFVLLGLFGEVGGLLSALKKKQRDKDAFVAYHDVVLEELGDSLWYFANAALRAELPLSVIAQRTPATLDNWDYHGRAGALTFVELQRPNQRFAGPVFTDAVEHRLLALAGKVGRLLEDWSSGRIAANRDVLSADLVEIFRALLAAADDAEVSLEEAARRNVVKTLGRWPDGPDWGQLFDADTIAITMCSILRLRQSSDGRQPFALFSSSSARADRRWTRTRTGPEPASSKRASRPGYSTTASVTRISGT
jgi:NTP pyrophosphatase (non-canonical NTP hydrolase)